MKGLTTGWKRVKGKRIETGQVNRERISTGLTGKRRKCIFVLVVIC